MSDNQYEYLKRQHYLATHMELTEENVVRVLEELVPYIEADGGFLHLVEIEYETGYVKVKLGGACETCAMSTMTLKSKAVNLNPFSLPFDSDIQEILN